MAVDCFITAILLIIFTVYAFYLETSGKHRLGRFMTVLLIGLPVLALFFLQLAWIL